MRPLKELISLDAAFKIITENTKVIRETESVNLLDLAGRVAAKEICAKSDVPPFRRAAMDGYAVKAASTFGASDTHPIYLTCIEKIHAGEVPTQAVSESSCIEIATGAMCPQGADTVVPVEYTNIVDDKIEILKAFAPGDNVSPTGIDIKKGEVVIHTGDVFTPARIGAIAALNLTSAEVYRKPKIAVIPTGREIAPLGSELHTGQVYDINSYTISTLITQHGGIPKLYEIIPDEFKSLERAVLDALSTDLVIILGGSSVGERDINIDVIRKHGIIFFHGVQVKPGKPTLCGKIRDTLLLNLPGYPTSCLTNGYVLLVPVLQKMASLPSAPPRKVKARLSRKIVSRLGRHQIFTVKLEGDKAVPAFKESGAITSMAWADGYIEIPFNVDLLEKDEEVDVTLF
ncbi:MAG: molybdopterin-binding protein [Candidatus Helarchaeota archaeon]